MIKNGIYKNEELSNEEYHKVQDESPSFSSSQLKDAKNIRVFHQKYILKTIKRKSSSAMDVGTYFHTAVLEPEKLDAECAVFDGRRAGDKWKKFQEEHAGKTIITKNDDIKAQTLINGVNNSKVAMDIINAGDKEVSFFTDLLGLRVKARADVVYLSKDHSYIADPKSCTGDVYDSDYIQRKVDDSNYDLSAALYIDIINDLIDKLKLPYAKVSTFYWIFATKDCEASKVYFADEECIEVGREKYQAGIRNIVKAQENDWTFPDCVEAISPTKWGMIEWLKPKMEKERKAVKLKTKVSDEDLL